VELQGRLQNIQAQGLGLVAISYDSPEILAAFSRQRGITFPLLSDANSTTIKAFGILNPAVEWGLGPDKDDPAVVAQIQKLVSGSGRASENQRGMAIPGTFVVDRRGRVTSRHFEELYFDRTTSEGLLLAVGAGSPPVNATRVTSAQLDLTVYPSDAAVAPGNRFALVVDITPRAGMHVYAPGASSYRALTLDVASASFMQLTPVRYPPSEIYFFKPLNERVPVFQKPFKLVQDVLLEGTPEAQKALQGRENLTLTGTVNYQACDDRICYDPVSVPVTWTIALKQLIRDRPPVAPPPTGR